MGLCHSPNIVTNGLVGYWDAGNVKSYPGSGAAFNDLSGNANHATLVASPTYSAGGLTFNGTTQYGTITNSSSISFTDKLSVSVWCTGSSMATFDTFIGKSTGNTWTDGFGLHYTGTAISFWVNSYSVYKANYTIASTFGVTNFTGVYNGANVLLYVNGVLVTTGSALTGNVVNPAVVLYLMNNATNSWAASGILYSAALYNTALSGAEISQNFHALRGRFGI